MKDIFDSIDANSEKKEVIKNGRPWDNHGPFVTHEIALSAKSKFLKENFHFDAKIKHLEYGFFLKTRKQIAQVLKEQRVILDQEKAAAEKNAERASKGKRTK